MGVWSVQTSYFTRPSEAVSRKIEFAEAKPRKTSFFREKSRTLAEENTSLARRAPIIKTGYFLYLEGYYAKRKYNYKSYVGFTIRPK